MDFVCFESSRTYAHREWPDDYSRSDVDYVMRARSSTRSFLTTPVSKVLVREILDVARFAPSNSNIQPWKVHATTGEDKRRLSAALCEAHEQRPEQYNPCYKHFPDVLADRYAARQMGFAAEYYGSLGIDRTDAQARANQTGRNFHFFEAPVGLIFTIDSTLERGSWLDYGMFLQNIMLAAKARGLDTCPQISFVKYHEIIRNHVPILPDELIVCGMSLGYANRSAPVNSLEIVREPVDAFATFSGFDI